MAEHKQNRSNRKKKQWIPKQITQNQEEKKNSQDIPDIPLANLVKVMHETPLISDELREVYKHQIAETYCMLIMDEITQLYSYVENLNDIFKGFLHCSLELKLREDFIISNLAMHTRVIFEIILNQLIVKKFNKKITRDMGIMDKILIVKSYVTNMVEINSFFELSEYASELMHPKDLNHGISFWDYLIYMLTAFKKVIEVSLKLFSTEILIKRTKNTENKENTYKTSICRYWEQGDCPFGERCCYAHGKNELQDR